MIKLVIFDFDGTIANTKEITYLVYEKLHLDYGLKKLTKEDIDQLKHMNMKEKMVLHDVKFYQIPKRIRQTKKIIHELIDVISPNEGMKELIHTLKIKGYTLGIVSSNSIKNIMYFLKKHEMDDFEFIYGNASMNGKKRKLKKLIKKSGHLVDETIYIGDEIRDIKAAKKLDLKIISCSFGFDDYKLLLNEHPDGIADHPDAIIHLIKNLS